MSLTWILEFSILIFRIVFWLRLQNSYYICRQAYIDARKFRRANPFTPFKQNLNTGSGYAVRARTEIPGEDQAAC